MTRTDQLRPLVQTIVFILVLPIIACNNSDVNQIKSVRADTIPKNISITAGEIAGSFSQQSYLKMDRTVWDSFFLYFPLLRPSEQNMRRFYTRRNFALAWFDSSGLTELAGNLFNRVQNLQAEGLSSTIPYLPIVDSLMAYDDITDMKQTTNTDLLLTGLYFYFADKVWGGLSEAHLKKIDWFLPRKQVDYEAFLDSVLQPSKGATRLREPVYRQYGLLKSALSKYKDLSSRDAWSVIVAGKKIYHIGDSAKMIPEIKKRLYLLEDMPVLSEGATFDSALVNGVKNFQHRFGLKEDGVIDQRVIKELNIPLQKRISQIIVNLERSRWLPDELQGNYLAVNIPEFKLHVLDGDSILWSMNVVVGKSANKTVVFSGDLKYVVFSPYWNVPPSILKKEILPGIQRNKNYLASHHMEWYGKSVRQKPGPWNSLGQVKFLFPNSYNIYLHDTPSKNLFKEDQRAFSHGCIRIAEPKKLAKYLLRNDPAWDDKKIVAAMNSGKEQFVTLKQTIPVFIAYLTAWVDRQGHLNFRDDIYNRDSRLLTMMSD